MGAAFPPGATTHVHVEARERSAAWRWMTCVLLMAATALSYLDRQSLSLVAPFVQVEMGLDNAQLGFLLSSFFWSYAAFHIGAGWLLDRWNIRWAYGAFVGCWSLSQIFAGAAGGVGSLAAARLALGAFEAGGQIGAARIIARLVPPADRPFANGLMMSGGSMGAMVAPMLVLHMAGTFGWRRSFVVLGSFGFLWTAVWLYWFRPSRDVLYGRATGGAPAPGDRWGAILRSRRFWASVAAAAFGVPILHVSGAWVPAYLVQQWKLPVNTGLGLYLFLIYAGLDVGFLGQGLAVRALTARGWALDRARKGVLVVAGLLMLGAAFVPLAPSAAGAVGLVLLLNVGRAAWGALFLSFNQELAPGRVATIAGIMGAIGALSGAVVIWVIGILSRSMGFGPAFGLVALLAVLGVTPLLLVRWDGDGAVDSPRP